MTSGAPPVQPGDWIRIGSIDCVIAQGRGAEGSEAELTVVCNLDRPTLYRANWTGESWSFLHPMRGHYAEYAPLAAAYVQIFLEGPPDEE
jgi:hypothetical protein